MFCIVFCVRKATFTFLFRKNFVTPLTSFSLYVMVTHFFFGVAAQRVYVFVFFVGFFLTKPLSYPLFCSMFLIVFSSMSFAFSLIGYVCSRFNKYLIPDNLCSYG
jgi:hypothetical protein